MLPTVITGGTSGIGKACADLFRSKGHEVYALGRKDLDLTDTTARLNAWEWLPAEGILVHCAYTYQEGAVEEVGHHALMVLFWALVPHSTVVVSSAVVANPSDQSPYAKDKRKQEQYARYLARHAKVNIVRPHLIMGTRTHPKPRADRARTVPLKRYGRPEEVAEVIYLAATNPHMTGSVLTVDGGYSLQFASTAS